MVCFQITKKVYKYYREKLVNMFWFLNIISGAGYNIAHTKSHLLLKVLSGRFS